jgi:hypothetical protein
MGDMFLRGRGGGGGGGSSSSTSSSRLTYISMVYLLHVTRSDSKKPLTLDMLLYFAMVQ